ncbi:MAG: cytochrome c [Rhodospirillales bacterium]|nr:cytochrome c [Rhodospirillales bacterium]
MRTSFAGTFGLLVCGALGAVAPAYAAPSAKAGAAISAQCAACHGNNGIAVATNMPNLAGQNYAYLLSQLEAYKNGTRKNPLMNEMAKPLSQQQMQDLAAYFASIPIRVGPPGRMHPRTGR